VEIVQRALEFAAEAHRGQVRKSSSIPYVVHCVEVMKRVSDYGIEDPNVLSAALLHDILEDCSKEYCDRIIDEFGMSVMSIVRECTRLEGDEATKKEKYDFLSSFKDKSIVSVVIKIADRFCNVMDYGRAGKNEYASKYALQAYPLYRTFAQRHIYADYRALPRSSNSKVLADIVDLNIIINEEYRGFSSFVCNMDKYVQEIVIGKTEEYNPELN